MRFVEEIVVEEFLPTVRSMLAAELRERDRTQQEVAELLGISQSAVSKYVHGAVDRNETIADDEAVVALVERVAEGLVEGTMTPVQALVEVEVLIRELERGGPLARLHEEAMPGLTDVDADFGVHDRGLRTSERVRASIRRGLATLTETPGFAELLPHVGSNLVECAPDARDLDDVAGVPGRIVEVKGRATVPDDPEFGVSEHVASVLLAARAGGADARSAVALAHDPDLAAAVDADGIALEFDPDAPEASVANTVDETDAVPETFALYQVGAHGVEPILYLLGPDAPTVARAVRELT